MKKILFQQLKNEVIKQEIGYLESVAQTHCTPEEFQEYKEETLSVIRELFESAQDVEGLGEVLENELGIDNPYLYILDNFIIAN
jgi:hypothetical protein